ncbi:MAG: Gfo/Idh/MocA family oxidoreductase [Lachnospiraceae bacterium]|nr:Gfo/Idh/MocA family oxidoreductase [Lachnospiraceae bacterium]
MDHIRLGIAGVGNMGYGHLTYIVKGQCNRIRVTAVSDPDINKLKRAAKLCPNIKTYEDTHMMLDSGLIDAVLIATPHYKHPDIAKECFKRGLHVLTEKPAGVYTRQVREMNDAAISSGSIFAIMFNQRTNPLFVKARDIIKSGELGEPKRLTWIITNWYRTQAYYDSGIWRGTWNGEGGGVLLNQAPHNLDLWQWIFGMPKRLKAFCSIGKYHRIGVEDDVTIFGEYDNGATATFITSTGETPGTNRLEISADKGKLVLEGGILKWTKLKIPERELCFTCKSGFWEPETEYELFSSPEPDGHPIILNNFADAILDGTPLIARGEEGLNSLYISNAAYISSWTDDWSDIPVNEEVFEQYLEKSRISEKISDVYKNRITSVKEPESVEELLQRWQVKW